MDKDDIRANLDQPSVPDDEQLEEEAEQVKSEEEQPSVEADNVEEETEEDTDEVETEEEAETTTVEKDPPRVPYSRFETVHERAIRAEEQLKVYKEAEERERLAQAAATTESGLPDYWVKLYGDSDVSKEAYQLRQQELREEREQLRNSLREDMQREQVEEEERTEATVEDWTGKIDQFATEHKRKFSESQTDALLDVMDELTPKDEDGNYLIEPIHYLPQAVELYDLRMEKATAKQKDSRKATARLTSAKSEGVPTAKPGEWDGNWEKKLTKMGL